MLEDGEDGVEVVEGDVGVRDEEVVSRDDGLQVHQAQLLQTALDQLIRDIQAERDKGGILREKERRGEQDVAGEEQRNVLAKDPRDEGVHKEILGHIEQVVRVVQLR